MADNLNLESIVTEPRYLDGYHVKACLNSGFCCTKAPCGFGERNDTDGACKYLLPANSIGQMLCGRYEWIKENVPDYEYYPGFGTGCCMGMFNKMRDEPAH